MALLGINPSRPKQDVDPLQRVAAGIDIAKSILGLGLAIPEFLQKKEAASKEFDLANVKAKADIASKFDIQDGSNVRLPGTNYTVPGEGIISNAPAGAVRVGEEGRAFGLAGKLLVPRETGIDALENKEKARRFSAPSQDDISAFKKLLPDQPIPKTVGQMEDLLKAQAGAINISPLEEKKFKIEEQKFRDQQKKEVEALNSEKRGRYIKELDAYAPTLSDAKEIKDSLTAKNNAISNLDKLIALREKNPYGNVLDRDLIAVAKQDASDLGLQIKQMAALGTLSKTDFEFLDRLVPKDPLAVNALAAVGQDPVLAQLKNLKQKFEEKFNAGVKARGLQKTFEQKKVTEKIADEY